MQIHLVLLCLSLLVAPECSCLRTKGEYIRSTVNRIISIAQTTLVRIEKLRTQLQTAPQIKISTPSVDGLTSISHYLGLLDDELRSESQFTELLRQIHTDVSSLKGWLLFCAQLVNCSITSRPKAPQSKIMYPDSQAYLTLTKVQLYMEELLLHKEKLMVC